MSTTSLPPEELCGAISLVGALLAGGVLAVVLIPHFGAWTHFEAFHYRH